MKKLNQSHWKKSCPKCSVRAGKPIYKDFPAEFGRSDLRALSGAQSWCNECRSEGRVRAS